MLGRFMGNMGLGRCVFTNKGFLDKMGMGDRGVRGSFRWYLSVCGKLYCRGDGVTDTFIGDMGLVRCVFMNKGFLDKMGMGDRGVRGSSKGYVSV